MGLTTGNFPPVEPATFMQTPYRERTKTLARHWAEYGFGTPKIIALIYIVKLLFFYVLGGVLVATLTSGLDPLHPAAWWNEPIVYQKAVIWTVTARVPASRGVVGPAVGALQADDRRPALLRAREHDPAAAVAGQGAVHAR